MLRRQQDEGDDMGEKTQVIVVGGGASGLAAAIARQRMVRQLRSLNRMRIRAGKSV